MKRLILMLLTLIFALSACTTSMDDSVGSDDLNTPQTDNYLPQPGDTALRRETAFAESVDLLVMESYPLQFMLVLQGNLPTPCHQLRVEVRTPDAQNRIAVEVYSVIEPDIMCMEVIQPFDVNVPLGSFPAGKYTLWVNGELASEFESQ